MKRYFVLGFLFVSLLLVTPKALVFAQASQSNRSLAPVGVQSRGELAGNYRGSLDYPKRGLKTDAILEIQGDTFSFASVPGAASEFLVEGRILTNTTGKYIAATLKLDDGTATISVRVLLRNGGIELASVPGEKLAFSFIGTAGGISSSSHRRRHHRHGRQIPEGEPIRRKRNSRPHPQPAATPPGY